MQDTNQIAAKIKSVNLKSAITRYSRYKEHENCCKKSYHMNARKLNQKFQL